MSNLKQFYVPISMLPKEKLKRIGYSWEGRPDREKIFSCFPSIPMIKNNLSAEDNCDIIAIKTNDAAGRTEYNFTVFEDELKQLSQEKGMEIKVSKIINIEHNETKEKHTKFFYDLCKSYVEGSEVYFDITYGTKVSPIAQFATLVYAEKNRNCTIAEVIYGKYTHIDGDETGTIYDITSLYELNMLINNCSMLPGVDIDKILKMYGED